MVPLRGFKPLHRLGQGNIKNGPRGCPPGLVAAEGLEPSLSASEADLLPITIHRNKDNIPKTQNMYHVLNDKTTEVRNLFVP